MLVLPEEMVQYILRSESFINKFIDYNRLSLLIKEEEHFQLYKEKLNWSLIVKRRNIQFTKMFFKKYHKYFTKETWYNLLMKNNPKINPRNFLPFTPKDFIQDRILFIRGLETVSGKDSLLEEIEFLEGYMKK